MCFGKQEKLKDQRRKYALFVVRKAARSPPQLLTWHRSHSAMGGSSHAWQGNALLGQAQTNLFAADRAMSVAWPGTAESTLRGTPNGEY